MALSGELSPTAVAARAAVAELDDGPLVVALSGGADSAVAAWACADSRPSGSVRAIHINHGWPASTELQAAAEAIAGERVSDTYDAMLLSHMISTKLGLEKKEIYDYIASQALFQKGVDLRNYADVVAMMHQIKGSALSKKELQSIKEHVSIV